MSFESSIELMRLLIVLLLAIAGIYLGWRLHVLTRIVYTQRAELLNLRQRLQALERFMSR